MVHVYDREKVALGQVAETAHDEVLYLIFRTMGLPMDSKPAVLKRIVSAKNREKLSYVFSRRVLDRVPAAYLTQEAFLGDFSFYVDERVIIPRSYFLEIIPESLPDWLPAGFKSVRRAADVCTGSGCLAVLLAKYFRNAQVDAIELSPEAAEVAKINLKRHRLGKRVALHLSDCFDEVPSAVYDVIISNPPYEPSGLIEALPMEYKREPRMALDGGTDGMAIVRKIIKQAATRLAPHGVLLLEIGALHGAIEKEFGHLQPVWLQTQDGSDSVCLFQSARLRPNRR